jgi:hypothetical protein
MPDLFNATLGVAPFYGGELDTANPEKQLLEAFRKAKEHLFKVLPPGTKLDRAKSILAADLVAQQIQANNEALTSSFNSRTDLSEDSAMRLDSHQMRQYHVGKYLVASGGLGMYTSGVGKDLVEREDYLAGIEGRIRVFSEIIAAGEKGQLGQLVNAEQFAGSGGRIIVASNQSKVITQPPYGLGDAFTIAVVVLLVGAIITGGIVANNYFKRNTEAAYAQSQDICRDAMEKGYKDIVKQCVEMSAEATQGGAVGDLLGAKATKDITKYLLLFGGVYLGVLLLPSLTQSAVIAQEASKK